MIETKTFALEVARGVATITLDRPKRLNALTFDIYRELRDVIERTSEHHEIRALVLTGEGRAFCSGGDVEDIIGELAIALERERVEPLRPVERDRDDAAAGVEREGLGLHHGACSR